MIAAPEVPAVLFQTSRFVAPGPAQGVLVAVRSDDGAPLLWFPAFAAISGIVSFFVAATVILAGLAATIFLLSDGRIFSALLALLLSAGFIVALHYLLPRIEIPIFEDEPLEHRVLTLTQLSRLTFPGATFAVSDSFGRAIGKIRLSGRSRVARHRWVVLDAGDHRVAVASEDSYGRAMLRKIAGKFRPELETNLIIRSEGRFVGSIIRRREPDADRRLVDVTADHHALIDRRLIAALGILVFGLEP